MHRFERSSVGIKIEIEPDEEGVEGGCRTHHLDGI